VSAGDKTWRAVAVTRDQITTAWLATTKIAQCLGPLVPSRRRGVSTE